MKPHSGVVWCSIWRSLRLVAVCRGLCDAFRRNMVKKSAETAAAEARLLLEIATDIGRAGISFAEVLLKDYPADSPDFDREEFFQKVEAAMENKS